MGNCFRGEPKTKSSDAVVSDEQVIDNCPICMEPIHKPSLADVCRHKFCFQCLLQWSQSHNRCPVCRQIYTKIISNIRSDKVFDVLSVREPNDVTAPVDLGYIRYTIQRIRTPDTGLFLVYTVGNGESTGAISYRIKYLGPNRNYLLTGNYPNMQMVLPNNLINILDQLNPNLNQND